MEKSYSETCDVEVVALHVGANVVEEVDEGVVEIPGRLKRPAQRLFGESC